MSKGINKCIILGNLGKDPDIRYMPSGGAVANFSIATSESWKDKTSGEKQEKTEWHNCVAFGKLAEIIGQYLKKGSKVYVEGSLQTDKYDKEGVTHYSTKIKVRDLQMLDGKPQGGSDPAKPAPAPAMAADDDFSDDIPF